VLLNDTAMINQDFKSILDLIKTFPDEQTCIDHLETLRWNGNVISPFDATSKVYKCKGNKYRCKNTGKYFNVKTDTLFDNTKIELQKWFLAIWIVTSHKKGISSLQLGRDLNITQKSAWFMLQRIRNCFGIENDNQLDNEVEADETYVGGKNKNRHGNKKVEASQGRSAKDKTPVLGMVERNGKLNAKTVANVQSATLTKEIVANVKESASLYTDEWLGYKGVSRIYDHSIVKHNKGQYVNGRIHTNTIEGFWSLLKRGIFGIYHFTSKKHLQMYVDEFVFRYNTRDTTEAMRFNLLLANTQNRLTYKTLIG
jgi:transposase-like protein